MPALAGTAGPSSPDGLLRIAPLGDRGRGRGLRRLIALRRLVGVAVLLVVWTVASIVIDDRSLLPTPVQVWEALLQLLSRGQLVEALGVSTLRVLVGLALGVLIGTLLAIVSGISRLGEDALDPVLQMWRSIPILAMIPLFILWFGIGEPAKIAMIAVGTMFPIYINLHAGIRGIDRRYLELARTQGLGRIAVIRQILLPGALPSWFAGLRYSSGFAWVMLVAAEQVNADSGLGYIVNQARQNFRMDILFVGLIVYGLAGYLTDRGVHLLERWFLRWRGATR